MSRDENTEDLVDLYEDFQFTPKYLNRLSRVHTTKESSPLSLVEYNSEGSLFSYRVLDTLKLYSAASGNLKSIFTVNFSIYKFLQENTLLHGDNEHVYYMSVFDNQYLAKFSCPSTIDFLSVDSINDLFMTGYLHGFSLFDIRLQNPTMVFEDFSANALGCLSTDHRMVVCDSKIYRCYDLRSPKIPLHRSFLDFPEAYNSIEFTSNNSSLHLKSNYVHRIINTDGTIANTIVLDKRNDAVVSPFSTELFTLCQNKLYVYKISDSSKLDSVSLESCGEHLKYKNILHSSRENPQICLYNDYNVSMFDY